MRLRFVVSAAVVAALGMAGPPAHAAGSGRYVVGGVVYNDANGNSIRDSDEKGVAGVNVALSKGASAQTQATTDQGTFVFTRLEEGEYTVELGSLPDGLSSPGASKATVEIGTGKELGSVSFPLVSGGAKTASGATTTAAGSTANSESTTTDSATRTTDSAASDSAASDSASTDSATTEPTPFAVSITDLAAAANDDQALPSTGWNALAKSVLGAGTALLGLAVFAALRRRATVR